MNGSPCSKYSIPSWIRHGIYRPGFRSLSLQHLYRLLDLLLESRDELEEALFVETSRPTSKARIPPIWRSPDTPRTAGPTCGRSWKNVAVSCAWYPLENDRGIDKGSQKTQSIAQWT
jgi:hypothetical protein